MKRTIVRLACAGALLALTYQLVVAQQSPATEEHKGLATEVGEWDAEITLWYTPDAEPVKSKGMETNRMLGGVWLISDFEGEAAGEKFQGHMQLGYDPQKKKYVGTWIDTMSPYLQTMEGDYDKATHTSTMLSKGVDIQTGKPSTSKNITRYEGEDAKTFEMHMPLEGQEGKWWKMMEIKYKRRK